MREYITRQIGEDFLLSIFTIPERSTIEIIRKCHTPEGVKWLYADLQLLTGERYGDLLRVKVHEGKTLMETIEIIHRDEDIDMEFMKMTAELAPRGSINYIYPIKRRKKILELIPKE